MALNINMSPLERSSGNVMQGLRGLGQDIGNYQQNQKQQEQEQQLQGLMQSAAQGDQQAIETLYSIDPQIAQGFEQRASGQANEAQKARDFATADAVEQMYLAPDEQKEGIFNQLVNDDRFDIDEEDREHFMNKDATKAVISQIKGQEYADNFFGKDTNNVDVQSSKILDDGTVIEVMRGGERQVISPTGDVLSGEEAKEIIGKARDQAHKRKIELKKLDQTIKREQEKEGLLNDQQKAIQRGNIQRLGTLSNTSSGRGSAIQKATKFKMALESGTALSGAGRKAATFIPGVYSSQGEFDEEFNAFSEVAARQQLKASGETRPTDADVQGMKQAMFGIGRDESVNVQLLEDFIKDQQSQNSELDQLIDASKSGNLSGFTFTPTSATVDVGRLSDEDLFN